MIGYGALPANPAEYGNIITLTDDLADRVTQIVDAFSVTISRSHHVSVPITSD